MSQADTDTNVRTLGLKRLVLNKNTDYFYSDLLIKYKQLHADIYTKVDTVGVKRLVLSKNI